MTVIIALVILGLVAATSAYYEPDCQDIQGTLLLPNLEDCTSYFICRGGYAILIPCADGLNFNPKSLKCTSPEEANCEVTIPPIPPASTSKPTTTSNPSTPSGPVKCPASTSGSNEIVLLPNPSDCKTYFRCRAGIPIITSCPDGLHFDPKNLECTFPEDAGCVVTSTTSTATATPPTTTTTVSPYPVTMTTPTPNTITTTSSEPTTPEYPVTCPAETSRIKHIKLPNPKDCTTYYECHEGVPRLVSCPKGLHFDPKNLECTYPEEAGCEKITTTTTPEPITTTTTTSKPTTTITPEPITTTTTTPKPTTTTTPEPITTTTTTPKPTTTTTPEPTTTTTTTPKPTTTTTPEPTTTTTPKPTTTTTPEPTTTTTTTPKPTTTTTPEPTTTTTTLKPITTTPKNSVDCPNQSNDDVLLPNPTDCGSYYHCSNGHPWLQKCPPGLHFNAATMQCDWPENANCVES